MVNKLSAVGHGIINCHGSSIKDMKNLSTKIDYSCLIRKHSFLVKFGKLTDTPTPSEDWRMFRVTRCLFEIRRCNPDILFIIVKEIRWRTQFNFFKNILIL